LSVDARAALDVAVLNALFGDLPFGVTLLDPEGCFLRVNGVFAAANGPAPGDHVGRPVEAVLGEGAEAVRVLIERVVSTRQPLPPEDVSVVDAAGLLRSWRTSWSPALDADGRLVGVLAVGMETTAQREAERARAAAEQRLALVAGSAALLDGGLDAEEVARRLAALLVPSVSEWAAVHLVEEDGAIRFAAAAHREPVRAAQLTRLLERFPIDTGQPYGAGFAIATGQVQLLPEVTRELLAAVAPDDAGFVATMDELVVGAGVVVPLVARDRVLGAVSIARGEKDDAFTGDLPGLAEVVTRAALAVDNAVLYQRQSRIALTLQRALLPTTAKTHDGLRVAARYVPGVAGLQVGGDFYDVLDLPDGTVALVIGDVMGRGLHAAAVMGQLRAALRAYAHLAIPPDQLLTSLDAVVASLDAGALVTVSYTVVDTAGGRLVHASAGHLPPALREPDGSVRLLHGPVGPPLGSGAWAHEAIEHPLQGGSAILLCTDGLVEDRTQDIDRGMDQLLTALRTGGTTPEEIADHVLREMGRASGHDDDVAVLSVVVDD
jgi:hypothetical protein